MRIRKRVTLVLGAGASKPYNFPLGRELIQRIVRWDSSQVQQCINALGNQYPVAAIHEFQRELQRSGTSSIDAFLEHRPNYLRLGKGIIAFVLLPLQEHSALYASPETNWYQYLFNDIIRPSSAEDMLNCPLSVITFNYDRSLDMYLRNLLKSRFGLAQDEASRFATGMPIVHVHGRLCAINEEEPLNTVHFQKCSNDIQLVHEDVQKSGVLQKCQAMLSESDLVVLLGFGFHEANVRRLGLHDYRAPVLATTYGLTAQEVEGFVRPAMQMGPDQFTVQDLECLPFLRMYGPQIAGR